MGSLKRGASVRGRHANGATIHARREGDPETEVAAGPEPSGGGEEPRGECRGGGGDGAQGEGRRAGRLARHRQAGAERARGAALPVGRGDVPAGAGLRVDSSRAAAAGRDAGAAPSRVPGAARGRLPVHAVLRALPAVAGAARDDDAPGPPRRREDLRRLLGQEAVHLRPEDRRADRRRALRRRAGRLQLHLRRGDAHPARAGLDRKPHAGLRLLRRRHGRDGMRPAPLGRIGAMPLRAGHPAHLRGDGRALRHDRAAGAADAPRATRPRSRSACR